MSEPTFNGVPVQWVENLQEIPPPGPIYLLTPTKRLMRALMGTAKTIRGKRRERAQFRGMLKECGWRVTP